MTCSNCNKRRKINRQKAIDRKAKSVKLKKLRKK